VSAIDANHESLTTRSAHACEQRIPRAMVLRAVGPCARETPFQEAQVMHSVDVELLPSMRRAALALAADLKRKQALDAIPDAVVVRLCDARSPGPVDELDEALLEDCAHEIVIHLVNI
jgi:hypothetical protein